MKIKTKVKQVETGYIMNEEHNINNGEDMNAFAKNLIDNFNNTLRPNESPRELLSVELVEQLTVVLNDHSWEKQNSFTIIRGGSIYDIMKCQICGVTGKRHGIGNGIKRDTKFNGKCYNKCETAMDQINKNKKRTV